MWVFRVPELRMGGQTIWNAPEGYTPAAHLRRALGIILTANKTGNLLLLYSLLFHTPPLYTVQYVR